MKGGRPLKLGSFFNHNSKVRYTPGGFELRASGVFLKKNIMEGKKDQIKVGDIVSVNFNNVQFTLCRRAYVLYIPSATGDSWIFKEHSTNEIHYVSEGCTITLLEKL